MIVFKMQKQKGTIDSIESNVLNTQGHIESGSKSLKAALTYKAFGSAAGGAMIGTLVGGPVGFIAGYKTFLPPYLDFGRSLILYLKKNKILEYLNTLLFE